MPQLMQEHNGPVGYDAAWILRRPSLVANLSQNTDSSIVLCKICEKRSVYFGETEVLRKYCVRYFRCESCGFMQTEAPYWLEEAYSSAIAKQDVGAMERNLYN